MLPPSPFSTRAPFICRSRSMIGSVHSFRKFNFTSRTARKSPWVLKEKVPATQTFFTYRATHEGEFWFNVVTLDRTGRAIPPDVTKEPPGLIVIIDSTPPQADAQLLSATAEGQQVRCEIHDSNPDPAKTRFYYQTRDQIWRSLDAMSGQLDTFCIPGQAALTGMIRVVACDLAGNTSTREFNLATLPTALPKSGLQTAGLDKFVPAPPEFVASPPRPPLPLAAIEPIETVVNKLPVPIPTTTSIVEAARTPFALPTGPDMRPIPEITVPNVVPQVEAPAKRHIVNNSHVFLNYEVEQTGVSGVGRVEVWFTRDLGQSWHKLGEDLNRKGQAEVDLPGEGVYGVTVVIANGRGFGATPPLPGSVPDYWIEVDNTKPHAELLNVRSNPNGDDGSLHITWTAKDKNLHPEPIDLYYAVNRQGPWQPIAKGLKNEGIYRWTPAAEVGSHAFIRLTVRDQAGNTASSESVQPVPLDDMSRPRGRLVGVTTAPRTVVGTSPTPLATYGQLKKLSTRAKSPRHRSRGLFALINVNVAND